VQFYTGIHHPHQAHRFERAFISINALHRNKTFRVGDFPAQNWILDSAAFSEITGRYGHFRLSPAEYAEQIKRWSSCGNLVGAFTQDYMCEKFIFEGQATEEDWNEYTDSEGGDNYAHLETPPECDYSPISVEDHQEWAVVRYQELRCELEKIDCQVPLLPVLQGFTPEEYLRSLKLWEGAGALPLCAYVGVGSTSASGKEARSRSSQSSRLSRPSGPI